MSESHCAMLAGWSFKCPGRALSMWHAALLLPAISFALGPAAERNYTVAVVVAPGFYLVDAMGPLDVFRAVQEKAYANVNLSSHQYQPYLPPSIQANGHGERSRSEFIH